MHAENVSVRKSSAVCGGIFEVIFRAAFRIYRETGGITAVKAFVVPSCVQDAYPVETGMICGVENFFRTPVARFAFGFTGFQAADIKRVVFFYSVRNFCRISIVFPDD